MKKLFLLSILILFTQFLFAQSIPLDSITNYVGKTVTVCAQVQSAFIGKGDQKPTYLSFGKPFPDATLTVVIFENDLPNFNYKPVEFLQNKNICITGKVKLFKNNTQIIVSTEDQIKIK